MPKSYDLYLKGYVGDYNFDANYVDYVLGKKGGKPVNVLINSLGGSVASALSIASAFKEHGDVTAHFVSMNASAATIASLGAKHITIDKNAMYLVHKCSSTIFEWDNFNADSLESLIQSLQSEKENLDKIDVNIATMYSDKCKKSVSDLLALMKKGGWLNAEEALEWGFVDEITESESKSPVMTEALASDFAENNIPLPDLPFDNVKDKSNFSKLIEALTSFFKGKKEDSSTPTNNIMKIESPIIASVLNKDIEADDNKITLTAEELASVENAISTERATVEDLNAQISQLNDRIAELEKMPGDETTTVNGNANDSEESPLDSYYDTVNKAKELYNLI